MLLGAIVDGKRKSWPCVAHIQEGRSNPDYLVFARELLSAMPYAKSFRDHCNVNVMRLWFPVHLEAFGVAVYVNGYLAWSAEAHKQVRKKGTTAGDGDDDDDEGAEGLDHSTVTSDDNSNYFPFTADARGAKRYKGWKEAGVTFYNQMVNLLSIQRQAAETGVDFENKLMGEWASMERLSSVVDEETTAATMALNGLDALFGDTVAV